MKRIWPYLGAVFPLTSTFQALNAEIGYDAEDAPNAMRFKNDRSNEDAEKASDGNNEAEAANTKSSSGAPSQGSHDDASTLSNERGDSDPHSSGEALPLKAFNHANVASTTPPALSDWAGKAVAGGGGGGGGGGVMGGSKRSKTDDQGSESDEDTSPDNTSGTDDPDSGGLPGYVDSDPADADAMMLLLGGGATGSGSGANSSGEVELEIVDYGSLTIGYGYAKYTASGDDGATADTFASVEGADLVYMFNFDVDGLNSAYSITYVLALDFENDADAQGWASVDPTYWLAQGPHGQWLIGPEQNVSVDGNTGLVLMDIDVQDDSSAVANASTYSYTDVGSGSNIAVQSDQGSLWLSGSMTGIDTFAEASGSLVEIDDRFSSVSGTVLGVA